MATPLAEEAHPPLLDLLESLELKDKFPYFLAINHSIHHLLALQEERPLQTRCLLDTLLNPACSHWLNQLFSPSSSFGPLILRWLRPDMPDESWDYLPKDVFLRFVNEGNDKLQSTLLSQLQDEQLRDECFEPLRSQKLQPWQAYLDHILLPGLLSKSAHLEKSAPLEKEEVIEISCTLTRSLEDCAINPLAALEPLLLKHLLSNPTNLRHYLDFIVAALKDSPDRTRLQNIRDLLTLIRDSIPCTWYGRLPAATTTTNLTLSVLTQLLNQNTVTFTDLVNWMRLKHTVGKNTVRPEAKTGATLLQEFFQYLEPDPDQCVFFLTHFRPTSDLQAKLFFLQNTRNHLVNQITDLKKALPQARDLDDSFKQIDQGLKALFDTPELFFLLLDNRDLITDLQGLSTRESSSIRAYLINTTWPYEKTNPSIKDICNSIQAARDAYPSTQAPERGAVDGRDYRETASASSSSPVVGGFWEASPTLPSRGPKGWENTDTSQPRI